MSTMNLNAVGGGNIHSSNMNSSIQILNLSNASQIQLQKHQQVVLELEIKKIMATIDVPTLPLQVRTALRNLGVPIRFFGENLADIRSRLRYELAKRQVLNAGVVATGMPYPPQGNEGPTATGEEEEEVTKYTHASNELVAARQAIAEFSLQRAQIRLQKERAFRSVCRNLKKRQRNEDIQSEDAATEQELESINIKCIQTYKSLRQMTLEGSQYGDSRALSCICTTQNNVLLDGSKIIATGSWTGNVQLWDGSGGKNTSLTKIGERLCCHEDRIMGMAMMTTTSTTATSAFLCTTSIDRTAKLWKVQRNGESLMLNEKVDPNHDSWSIVEQAHFKGHTKRLCRTAFHPMKKHLATTSFDYSWRLWDIETSQDTMQLLLQDGHWKETYGIGFHPDGSLCATTDFAGVIQLWDLRTGKSIRHFLGHAKRILNAEFHPTNGYQLVSSGDDGTIKIWDIRQRKQLSSIPAHSNLISQLRFDPDPCGEYLVSSSFDGTIKLWSTRTWKLLNTMKGHDGKVSGVDIISSMKGNHCARSIVSCGFDKTLKIWR